MKLRECSTDRKMNSNEANGHGWRRLTRLMALGWQVGAPDAQVIGRKIAIWAVVIAAIWTGLYGFGWPKLAWGFVILGFVLMSAFILPRRLRGSMNEYREIDKLLSDRANVGSDPFGDDKDESH